MAEILKHLKRRVRSVNNMMQVTRAMAMVSAAKLRRTQATVEAARPYAEKLQALLARVAASVGGELDHPLFARREEQRILVVLISGDRGLCGAFNSSLLQHVEGFLGRWDKDHVNLFCVGKRGRDHFRRRGWTIGQEVVDLRGQVRLDVTRAIASVAQKDYVTGATDAVYLCYNAQVTAVTYRAHVEKFLPLDPAAMGLSEAEPAASEYIFEPSREEVFAELLPRYCESRIYATLAEALTAEHSARMIAMNNASKNCEEMIDALTLRMNKARQASITKEILDIVGGAEAIKG